MHLAPAFAMNVLGDVGQQGEVAECPYHRDGLVDVHSMEHLRHLGAIDLGATNPKRFHPGAFDEIEHLRTVLFAHGVSEHRPEQSDVLPHRLGGLAPDRGAVDLPDGRQGHIRHHVGGHHVGISHASSISAGGTTRDRGSRRSQFYRSTGPQPRLDHVRSARGQKSLEDPG